MSLCRLSSFLALLFGAGVLGGFPASALAGDRIEFSQASETLAKAAADRPDSEPADALHGLGLGNTGPMPDMPYPMMSFPAASPSRRNDGLDFQNGTDSLSSGMDRLGQNDGFARSPWDTYATNYSSKPDSNASNYLSATRAWGTLEDPYALGRGADRMDSRYGSAEGRVDSLNPSERRDRLAEFGLGATANRVWAARREDGSGTRTSIADLLKQQNPSSFGANPGLFKSSSQFSDFRASSAWGSLSLLPSERSLTPPLDSTEPGYNGNREPRAPSSGTGRSYQNEGEAGGTVAMRASGDGLGLGFQATRPPPARKPLPSSTPGAGKLQRGGVTLPWAKDPNSVFK